MLDRSEAEETFKSIKQDNRGRICAEGVEYCKDKDTLEYAWNRCQKGQFLYTWLRWFCYVGLVDLRNAIGYMPSHKSVEGIPDDIYAEDIKRHFTYWGESK